MSEKVPLHVYEKARKSKKWTENLLFGTFCTVATSIVLGLLWMIGNICVMIWIVGGGGWMLLVFGVVGLLAFAAVKDNINDKIIQKGNTVGVVDE